MKANILSLLVCASALFISACGNKPSSSAKADTILVKEASKDTSRTKTAKNEYEAAYICPSHCANSGSDKPGTCKTCGMEYIENNLKK